MVAFGECTSSSAYAADSSALAAFLHRRAAMFSDVCFTIFAIAVQLYDYFVWFHFALITDLGDYFPRDIPKAVVIAA